MVGGVAVVDVTQDAGVLTTASNLLFSGGREGYFYALDARDGKLLWRFPVGGRVISGPMTYSLAGKQYVEVAAGNSKSLVSGLKSMLAKPKDKAA